MNQTPWEEEFDKKFPEVNVAPERLIQGSPEEIKDFIRSREQAIRAEYEGKIEEAREEGYEAGLNIRKEYNDPDLIKKITQQARTEVLEKMKTELEKLRMEYGNKDVLLEMFVIIKNLIPKEENK